MNIKNILKTISCYCLTPAYRRLNRSSLFDRQFYLSGNPDVKALGIDPLVHYIKAGWREERDPSPLFDSHYYLTKKPELKITGEIPLAHFLTKGSVEDRQPCRWFDAKFYKAEYPQACSADCLATEHYYNKGVFEGLYPHEKIKNLPQKPLISIVVPVYNVDINYLNRCLYSVLFQSYPHWQLCIADDCSTDGQIRETLEKWKALDKRIQTVYLDENLGISGATNAAAALATGDFVGFLDNDDELAPQCLFEAVRAICETGADLLYTDEDLINSTSRQTDLFYKPDFNRELLLCHNYITHFVVADMELFQCVQGFSSKMDGAQDFDLFLKLSEIAKEIVHIPEILYHWRAVETSTSINHSRKEYANEAGRQAVQAVMDRNSIEGGVEFTDWKFYYRCRRALLSNPLISVIICWENGDKPLTELIKAVLDKTHYENIEVLVAVKEKASFSDDFKELNKNISLVMAESGEGKAGVLNRAAARSHGEYIVFLGGGSLLLSGDWLVPLLEYGQEEKVGVVGGRLQQRDNRDLVSLTVPDVTNNSPAYYSDFFQGCSTHMNGLQCPQNVLAVSPSLCMVGKKMFEAFDGFDAVNFPNLFFTHDLCLRLYRQGYKNIYTPHCFAEIDKKPSLSANEANDKNLQQEYATFQKRWKTVLQAGDPYWNNGLLKEQGLSVEKFLKWYAGE